MAILITTLLILAVISLIMFRKPIEGILNNFAEKLKQLSGVDGEKLKLSFMEDKRNTVLSDYTKAIQSPFITNMEKSIMTELEKSNASAREKIEVLTKYLATMSHLNRLLFMEKNINQQQIELINYLNTNTPKTKDELKHYYLNSDCENFFDYLIKHTLIKLYNADDTQFQNRYAITDLGREFLAYLVKMGRKI